MTLIVAGERSGVGKTTITLALLSFFSKKQDRIQSFKVGPDYIDPMFHTKITGIPCRNLDPILTSENYVKSCYQEHSSKVKYALIEGVMGLFDGVSFPHSPIVNYGSTAHLAKLLNLPVLLVIDCRSLSGSVAAIVKGYTSLDPTIKIAGLVLNKVGSDRHLELLTDALQPLNIPILGVLRRQDSLTIPDRHLGLIPTTELKEIDRLLDRLAFLAETCFNWEQLLPLLEVNLTPPISPFKRGEGGQISLIKEDKIVLGKPRIAVAYDPAFNFYYQDNLDLLQQQGAELIFWSPLKDQKLPSDLQGLYFGGGFPEVFAEELANNEPIRKSLKKLINNGIIIYGECGGLMYLCSQIIDFEGKAWDMLGILPTNAIMERRLTLGYRQAITLQNTPILPLGSTVWGHEFHRSSLTNIPENPLFKIWGISDLKQSKEGQLEGWGNGKLHGSYLHLHWGDRPAIPQRFLKACLKLNS